MHKTPGSEIVMDNILEAEEKENVLRGNSQNKETLKQRP